MSKIEELQDQRKVLIEYLITKLAQEDWHGVRDVCVDIEIINAKIKILQDLM